MTKVSLIGCGRWGTFLAWYVANYGKADEVRMYDIPTSPNFIELKNTRKNSYLSLSDNMFLFDNLPAVMIGRGLIANPALALQIQGKKAAKEQLFSFQDTLLERYREVMSGDIHALHKMKEVWIYMAPHFTNYEKYLKKIKKTNRLDEYKAAVYQLFQKEDWVTA